MRGHVRSRADAAATGAVSRTTTSQHTAHATRPRARAASYGAGLLLDLGQDEVAPVGGLVLLVDSGEGLLEGVLGGGVEHLWLHARVVVAPRDKDELVGRRARLGGDLDVEDGVAAVAVRQLRCELLEAGALFSFFLDDNALLVVGDLEDNVLVRTADLHLIELLHAFGAALHAGRHGALVF